MALELDKLTIEDRVVLAQSSGLLAIFEDPISFEIMDKAMMTTCGHSFSEDTINNWILKKNQCPLCNKTLKRSDVTPNYALRNAIARFLTAQAHLQQNIQNALGNVSVSSEWTTPASPTDDFKTPEEDGVPSTSDSKLLVEIISARDLKTDWFGNTDPYCVLEFQDQKRKTSVAYRNRCPSWGEVFVFNVLNVSAESNIVITVWDKDRILKDSFIGMVTISMAEVITTLKMVRRFVLQKKRTNSRKKIGGDILLRLQFLDLRANYEFGRSSASLSSISPISSRLSTPPTVSRSLSTPPTSSSRFPATPPSMSASLPSLSLPPNLPSPSPIPNVQAPPPPPPPPNPDPVRRALVFPASPAPAPVQLAPSPVLSRNIRIDPRRPPSRISPQIRYSVDISNANVASGSGSIASGSSASSSSRSVGANLPAPEIVVQAEEVEPVENNDGNQENEAAVEIADEADNGNNEDENNYNENDDSEDGNDNGNNGHNNGDDDEGGANNDVNDGNQDDNDNHDNHADYNNHNEHNDENNYENNEHNQDPINDNLGGFENIDINDLAPNARSPPVLQASSEQMAVDLDVDIHFEDLNNENENQNQNESESESENENENENGNQNENAQFEDLANVPDLPDDFFTSESTFWDLPPPPPPPVESAFISTDEHSAADQEEHNFDDSLSPSISRPRSLIESNEDNITGFINSSDEIPYVPLAGSQENVDTDFAFTSVGMSPSTKPLLSSLSSSLSSPPLAPLSVDVGFLTSTQPQLSPTISTQPQASPTITTTQSVRDSAEIAQQMYEELHELQFLLQQKPPNESFFGASVEKGEKEEAEQADEEEVELDEEAEEDEEEEEVEEELKRDRRNNRFVGFSKAFMANNKHSPPPSLSGTLSAKNLFSLISQNPDESNNSSLPSSPSPFNPARRDSNASKDNRVSPQTATNTNSTNINTSSTIPSPPNTNQISASSTQSTPSHSRTNSNTNASIKNNRVNRINVLPQDNSHDQSPEQPPVSAGRNTSEVKVVANEDSVKALMEMGFERDLAEYALRSCNNEVESALDKLLNNTGQLQFELLRSLLFT